MALNSVIASSHVAEQVRAYRQQVLHDRVRPPWGQCPLCRARAPEGDWFRRHEARRRWFWVVVGLVVQRLRSLITRWKCVQCGRTFTLYPAFALPHKRYVWPSLRDRVQGYVQEEGLSYRRGVQTAGWPVFHELDEPAESRVEPSGSGPPESEPERPEPVLAHSTLYRWVTTLGGLSNTVRRASQLIRQRDPSTSLFQECARLIIPARKYRSPARRRVLHQAWSLAQTEAVYRSLFGVDLFPNLATVCGFT